MSREIVGRREAASSDSPAYQRKWPTRVFVRGGSGAARRAATAGMAVKQSAPKSSAGRNRNDLFAAVFDVSELRCKICSFIDEPRAVARLEQVSKGFMQSLADTYWRRMDSLCVARLADGETSFCVGGVEELSSSKALDATRWFLKRAARVAKVDLRCDALVDGAALDTLLAVVAAECAALTHLSVRRAFLRPDGVSAVVLRNAASLQHVCFEGTFCCVAIRSLQLPSDDCESIFVLSRLLERCVSLRSVRLARLNGKARADIAAGAPVEPLPRLVYPLPGALRSARSLDTLCLHVTQFASRDLFALLDDLPVRSLAVTGEALAGEYGALFADDDAQPHPWQQAANQQPAVRTPRLPHLRRLQLTAHCRVVLSALLDRCPRLEWLRVDSPVRDGPIDSVGAYVLDWLRATTVLERPRRLRVQLGCIGPRRVSVADEPSRSLARQFELTRLLVAAGAPPVAVAAQDLSRGFASFEYDARIAELSFDFHSETPSIE